MNTRFFDNKKSNKITIYNIKEDESFQRTVIDKVYVRKVRKISLNSNGEEVASTASITIPTKIAKINNQLAILSYVENNSSDKTGSILNFTLNSRIMGKSWTLMEGDYIVDGVCDLDFDMTKIKEKYKLFQIVSISDNRKGNLPHFKVEVSE